MAVLFFTASVLTVSIFGLVSGGLSAQETFAQVSALDSDPNAPEGAVAVSPDGRYIDKDGYLIPGVDDSEFNHHLGSYVRDWRESEREYRDTEFGEVMYNEPSTPTKLEILRLLSKDTPSTAVLMHALSMGIDIQEVLQASVRYEPDRAAGMTSAAVSILPLLSESANYLYSGYELQDLTREDDNQPYSVQEVAKKFFEQRLVLRPYPDWFEGQYHFLASAAELKELQQPQQDVRWYRTKSTLDVDKRPIFVSLYEATESVLIDGVERINNALASDPDALLPVVFIFNRLNERPIDQLGYPLTIRGVQEAYVEKQRILTPVPEWQLGDYHIFAEVQEFKDVFNIPEEQDFEPEAWQRLLEEAKKYSVTDTSFLAVIVPGYGQEENNGDNLARVVISEEQLFAAWDNPRTESDFKYVQPEDGPPLSLKNIQGKGIIFNRPDLLAALSALGEAEVPVTFYYLDSSRLKPFVKGKRALLNSVKGIIPNSPGPSGSGGITPCASPPCVAQ